MPYSKMAPSFLATTDTVLSIGVVLFFAGMPLGTSIQDIGKGLIILAVLMDSQNRARVCAFANSGWMIAIAVFLLLCIGSVLWTQGSYADWFYSLTKNLKLLSLPVLASVMVNVRYRRLAWSAFVFGMMIIMLLLAANYWHWLRVGTGMQGAAFRNYIMNGHMLAFTAFAAMWYAWQEAASQLERVAAYLMGTACVLSLVCLNQGRTGYVALFLMIGLYALCRVPRRCYVFAIGFSLFAAVFLIIFAPKIHQGFFNAYQHIQNFEYSGLNTSEGFRIQFWRYAMNLWLQRPLFGNGLGSFATQFALDKPVPAWTGGLREPHSQYFLVLSELGIVGLIAVVSIFALLLQTLCFKPNTRCLALVLLILFAAGNLSDSLLFYAGSGYFFLGFLGLLLGAFYASDSETLSIRRTSST